MVKAINYFLFFLIFAVAIMPASIAADSTKMANATDVRHICRYAKKADVIGLARDAKTQEPLYCEYHFSLKGSTKVVVEYRDLSVMLMAEKKLDYASGQLSPSVIQNDFRNGELRAASKQVISGQPEQVVVDVEYRPPNSNDLKESRINLSSGKIPAGDVVNEPRSLVIDAGFDYAVRNNWNTLYEGKAAKFSFVSPLHGQAFNLSIRRSNRKTCSQKVYDKNTEVCYLVKPSSAIISWFVKPIELVYEISSKQLRVFAGEVNITNADGKTQRAVIEYTHFN